MRRAWLRGRRQSAKTILDPHQRLQSRLGHAPSDRLRHAEAVGRDAKIGVIWLRYPIDDQHTVLLCCLVVIDGPYQSEILGIEATLLTR